MSAFNRALQYPGHISWWLAVWSPEVAAVRVRDYEECSIKYQNQESQLIHKVNAINR